MSEQITDRMSLIEQKLKAALAPSHLEIIDDSAHHIGHAGAQAGAGHYTVVIESAQFENLNTVKRHQLVYGALQDMIPDEIHALQIRASTPNEA